MSQVPRRAVISHQNTTEAGIQAIERHRVPRVTAESRSAATISINTTIFMHNAG